VTTAEKVQEQIDEAKEAGYGTAALFYVSSADVEKIIRANERMRRRIINLERQLSK
jgi:hypothetical protein